MLPGVNHYNIYILKFKSTFTKNKDSLQIFFFSSSNIIQIKLFEILQHL